MCDLYPLCLALLLLLLTTLPSVVFAGLVECSNDKVAFQATSVKATFRDGFQHDFDSDDWVRYNSTVIGDYLSFTTHDHDDEERQVRLYFIPPELDWKLNQTYHWKLNQAWVSDKYYGWLFWNVNGFVDSQIRVMEKTNDHVYFQCSHVEFTFYNNAPHGRFSRSQGKVVLENVKLSVFLSDTDAQEPTRKTVYNPCGNETGSSCRVVNGSAACSRGAYSWKYGATIVSLLVAVLVVVFANRRTSANRAYNRVDGGADEEEHGESTNEDGGDGAEGPMS